MNELFFDYATKEYVQARIAEAMHQAGGGGGGDSGTLKLISEYTATEDVSAIQINFTDNMRGYDVYRILLEGETNRNENPCLAFNAEPSTGTYGENFTANTPKTMKAIASVFDQNDSQILLCYQGSGITVVRNNRANLPISYLKIIPYYADGLFKTGFSIKIYGGNIE